MKVLIIAAHADDEVLGLGGTIVKHIAEGDEVHVLFLTDSSSTQYRGDKNMIKEKKAEAYRVCRKSFKVKGFKFLDFLDMKLDMQPIHLIADGIKDTINGLEPDIIYTHYRHDLNADHRIAYEATMVAARSIPNTIIYSYLPSMYVLEPFRPNMIVDITKYMERKLKAFRCYRLEVRDFPHERSIEAIKIIARYWGLHRGVKYGEPFRLIRG